MHALLSNDAIYNRLTLPCVTANTPCMQLSRYDHQFGQPVEHAFAVVNELASMRMIRWHVSEYVRQHPDASPYLRPMR
jgi:hypothetical protein